MNPFASSPSAAFLSADRLAGVRRLEAVLRAHERRGADGRAAPGFAAAVAMGDEVLLRTGVGLASIEQGAAITPRTAFRIASVSKQFTCAAVLLLARERKLHLDDDIRAVLGADVLPGLSAAPSGALSLRHLMHMTSGLRDFLTLLRAGGVELDQRVGAADIRAAIARHAGLNFAPNTRFLYCNTNYLLLGQAVEAASGESLADFLRSRFFEPLGMADTRHTPDPDSVEPGLATPYLARGADPRGGSWTRAAQRFPLGGEGGLVSTLDDLLIWAGALRKPPKGLDWLPCELARRLDFAHGHASVYARGQEVLDYRGLTTVGHGGLWPGFRTEFLLVPERGITAIVVANDSGVNPHSLARRLLDALLWPELGAPPPPATPCPAPGLYFNAEDGLAVEIGGPSPMAGNAPTLALFAAVSPLRAAADGWWEAEAGAIVLKVKAEGDGIALIDDAGRRLTLAPCMRAAALPDGIAGLWHCSELATDWSIAPDAGGAGAALTVAGPVVATTPGWRVRPLAGDWVEIAAASHWLPTGFTARLLREKGGRRLVVHTARARGLEFRAV